MAYETLLYDLADNGVATIALNQPDTRNALSDELLRELIAALEAARDDDAVRCVVLTSTHDRVFSAGANLGGFAADVPLVHKHFATERFPRLFRLLGELGKPSICAANGHVLAGALGIALACDLIIAREGARFGTPEINVGAVPVHDHGADLPQRPAQEDERAAAARRADLGRGGRADRDRQPGRPGRASSTRRSPSGRTKLAAKSPVMMRLGKDAMFRQQDMAFDDALDFLRSQLTIAFSTEDIQEGVKAFFEKREPNWTGR